MIPIRSLEPGPPTLRGGARLGRIALAVVVATSVAGCVVRVDSDGYREREEKRFAIKGRPTVQLTTFDGAIVIRGWDRDEVSVEIEKRGRDKAAVKDIEVVASQKGDTVSVEAREKNTGDQGSYNIGWHGVSRSARLV